MYLFFPRHDIYLAPSLSLSNNRTIVVLNSNRKGQLAVVKAEMRSFELGFIPSRPLYDNKYDLLIDNGNKIIRAQVKYADGKPSNSEGAVVVKLEYIDRQKNVYTYSSKQVDALIVYIPKVNRLCFIPKPIFIGKRKLNIRIKKPKNNQKNNILFASDFYW